MKDENGMVCQAQHPEKLEMVGHGVAFERTRRITGYLAPLDKFNNAKRAEERMRVKHGL